MDLDRNVLTAVLILALILSGTGYAALQYQYSITNHGNIISIGCAVLDENGDPLISIDWGVLTPSSSSDKFLYVKNNGTVDAALGLGTRNWNPTSAESFMTVTRNYSGQILVPNQQLPLLLTLQISPEIFGIEDFSFDVLITATEA